MAKIDELLKELCPDGVEYVMLGKECIMKRGTSATKASLPEGDIPVISGGVQPSFYCNIANRDGETITIAGSGASAGYVQYWNIPIFVCDAFSIKWEQNTRYLYFVLKKMEEHIKATKKGAGVPHVQISCVDKFKIPVPPLPIQQHIVEVLDTFTDAISNLEEELALREKQFEFYREQLFNFDEGEFEWKYIPELASYSTGLTYKPANVKDTGTLVLRSSNIKNNQLSFEDNVYVQMNIPERSKVQLHDILICVRNGSKNLVGKCAYISNLSSECAFGAFMNILRPYNINSKFLYYSWQLHSTINQYKGDDASPICQITNKDFARIRIKVPSEVRQQEIVEILDTFEAMIANIKEEIALRTKQYEYYREKLLSFDK